MEKGMKIIVIVGFPASGKSTYSKKIAAKYSKNGIILSRDTLGGVIVDILPKLKELLESKNNYKIIIDNTNITIDTRKPFVKLAQSANVPIEAHYIVNTIEDIKCDACTRRIKKGQKILIHSETSVKMHLPKECKLW